MAGTGASRRYFVRNIATGKISPVISGDGAGLPPATLIIFTLNQEDYVQAAIDAALAQDYPDLELIISDDGSNDRTYERICDIVGRYRGPHRVVVNQTRSRRGTLAHVYEAVALSHGKLIVIGAGDDIAYPDRVRETVSHWLKSGADALFSKYDLIDEHGALIEAGYEYDGKGLPYHGYFSRPIACIHGASSAYRRGLFDEIALPEAPILFEDTFMSLMLALRGGAVEFIDKPLVRYRRHRHSITNAPSIQPTLEAVTRHEKRVEVYARSMFSLLEAVRAAALGGNIMEKIDLKLLEDDIMFNRFRAAWTDASPITRLRALACVRRRADLRWMLPRLFGLRAFTASKKLQALASRLRRRQMARG